MKQKIFTSCGKNIYIFNYLFRYFFHLKLNRNERNSIIISEMQIKITFTKLNKSYILNNLLNNMINCSDILSRASFNVLSHIVRFSLPFHIPRSFSSSLIDRFKHIVNTDPTISLN